jgi:hypothetical protein
MEQAPVQVGQFILGKNLGIGAFGKVRNRLMTRPEDLDILSQDRRLAWHLEFEVVS